MKVGVKWVPVRLCFPPKLTFELEAPALLKPSASQLSRLSSCWFPRPEAPLERTEHPPRNHIPGLAHQQLTAYIHGSDLPNWSPPSPLLRGALGTVCAANTKVSLSSAPPVGFHPDIAANQKCQTVQPRPGRCQFGRRAPC